MNSHYQTKANEFADNLLLDIPEEYNKQIRSNALGFLIRGCIWAIPFVLGVILNPAYFATADNWWKGLIYLTVGIALIGWGIWGRKKVLKKLIQI